MIQCSQPIEQFHGKNVSFEENKIFANSVKKDKIVISSNIGLLSSQSWEHWGILGTIYLY